MPRLSALLCALMLFAFPAQAGAFGDAGNGQCVIGGCSGQLCVDAARGSVASTCEWRSSYACYGAHGICETQADGKCGWTPTDELAQCLKNPEQQFPLNGAASE